MITDLDDDGQEDGDIGNNTSLQVAAARRKRSQRGGSPSDGGRELRNEGSNSNIVGIASVHELG